MILYFSGTGNSEFAARRIGELTGDEVISLNDKIKSGCYDIAPADKYVFAIPTHGWRIPPVVSDWISKAQLPQNARVWFVMTCGSEIGAAEKYLIPLCEKKSLKFMGVAEIVMPENYIAMFNAPQEDEAKQIVKAALPIIDAAAERIAKGEALDGKKPALGDGLKSGIVNDWFYKYSVKDKLFKADDKCISCGLCEKLCPVNNISIENGKPRWKGSCIHCMACICHCPTKAIEYGRKSLKKPRYTCPKLDEMN